MPILLINETIGGAEISRQKFDTIEEVQAAIAADLPYLDVGDTIKVRESDEKAA